jgi:hypothetical protein
MIMSPDSLHAMLTGMVIMVLPALAICLGITIMAFRRRDGFTRRAAGKTAFSGRAPRKDATSSTRR